MHQVLEYIKFLTTATNQHGVHSPFVYDLVTKCLYDSSHHTAYQDLKAYRAQLLDNTTQLHITDLGSGSRTMHKSTRAINTIAKRAGTTYKRAKLLFRLAQYFGWDSVLELGTSLGIATQAMALGRPEAAITSLEGCPNTAAFARQQLAPYTNITIKTEDFERHLTQLPNTPFDALFIDGNHTEAATLTYFNQLLSSVHNDSVMIFDDIHLNAGMTRAWQRIKQHPKVTVTMDVFYWGLVFFRTEQRQQHFKIRL